MKNRTVWLVAAIGIACSFATGLIVWAVMYVSAASRPVLRQDANSAASPVTMNGESIGNKASAERSIPTNETSLFSEAMDAERDEDYTRAVKAYKELVSLHSNNAVYLVNLGECLYQLDDFDGAIDAFRRAIEIDHKSSRAFVGLGDALLKWNEIVLAFQAYEHAEALDPANLDINMRLVIGYSAAKIWDRAIIAAQRLVENARAYEGVQLQCSSLNMLANVYVGAERLADAVRTYSDVLAIDPKNETAAVGLARLQIADGNFQGASSALARLETPGPEALFFRGLIAFNLRNFGSAEESLRLAISKDGSNAEYWLILADTESALEQFESALSSIDSAIRLDADSTVYRLKRANTLLKLERYDEAVAECDRVLVLDPNSVIALKIKVLSLRILERWNDAAAVYSRLEELDPTNESEWRENRGHMHYQAASAASDRGQLQVAIAQCRLAVEADPSDENKKILVLYLSQLALEYAQVGRDADARAICTEIGRFDLNQARELLDLIQ